MDFLDNARSAEKIPEKLKEWEVSGVAEVTKGQRKRAKGTKRAKGGSFAGA